MSRADLTAATPFTRFLDQVVGFVEHAEFLDKVSAPVAAADRTAAQRSFATYRP